MEDCVFCKIVKGEVPADKVYEDTDFMGFLSIAPINKGQVLVIPKKHYRWTWDVPNFGEYWEAARKVTNLMLKGLGAKMVEYLTHGMEVEHAHIWVVPIYGNETFIKSDEPKSFTEAEMKDIAEKIRKAA
jgi:histidine triad (HIT) family protein